jgi:hypothetical protein
LQDFFCGRKNRVANQGIAGCVAWLARTGAGSRDETPGKDRKTVEVACKPSVNARRLFAQTLLNLCAPRQKPDSSQGIYRAHRSAAKDGRNIWL